MQAEPTDDDEHVMELTESALSRPAQDRAKYLESACGPNIALYHEVLERVAWEERMGTFLKEPVMRRHPAREQIFALGAVIGGHFRVIGEAAPGAAVTAEHVVYEAVNLQSNERVALRFLRPGQNSPCSRGKHKVHRVETAEGPLDIVETEFPHVTNPGISKNFRDRLRGLIRGLVS
jgi:hypothetical protein